MKDESSKQRSDRILNKLKNRYPGKSSYDLSGIGTHFVCEVEPTADHSDYDRAIEIIISSKPHKHLKMTQYYTVLFGTLELHVDNKIIELKPGDKYNIYPHSVHWALSDDECWVEIYSTPGWVKEDHISID